MRLHKLAQLEDVYRRLRPNIEPNVEFIPHWRKSGYDYDADIVILDTRLYGDIFRIYFWYAARGQLKGSGTTKLISL